MTEHYVTKVMDQQDVLLAVEWAAGEGWNPGNHDAACFSAQDPNGFIGGYLGDRLIASISVTVYDPGFAFLGFYIVSPEYRGHGHGYALWQAGMIHAGARNVGLDGVVAEQENYKRSGFDLAYRNIRYGGTITVPGRIPEPGLDVRQVEGMTRDLVSYDRTLFPADRDAFLSMWLTAPGHIARQVILDGSIVGMGVARPCRAGWKLGQVFAEDRGIAEALIGSLLDAIVTETGSTQQEIYLDVPESNGAAVALAEEMGLSPSFETARMYTGSKPDIALSKIFGVTSFELG